VPRGYDEMMPPQHECNSRAYQAENPLTKSIGSLGE
jgi:hypothetical protein